MSYDFYVIKLSFHLRTEAGTVPLGKRRTGISTLLINRQNAGAKIYQSVGVLRRQKEITLFS
ncbi:hypothetical protein KUH03_38180 [Sphingobacterium sp. E70]|uniref:hypothetical protein n=1 Tax=Sphingobacterium sp. E70 TaxID=2853439 RepID=UPI00211CA280|nr:hypothetical protein [Sphingobacterium sp. E70]ULT24691.1 hypothetical protein KUH03_38180 [Sphingobacterium sp. E70]